LKILFLVPAPLHISPGQRFRFEHYILQENTRGFTFTIKPFYSRKAWNIIHKPKHLFDKIAGIATGIFKRYASLFSISKYDYVYIYREAVVVGPPILEWLIAKVFRKKIIYDFDDAIWVSTASASNPGAALVKCTWKVANICRMSSIVTTGNEYLGDYARQYCNDVRVIPTVVNTETRHRFKKNQSDQPLTIGWTGTFTNFPYLEKVNPVINKLREQFNFRYLIIADKDPGFSGVEYDYIKWNLQTEIEDLLQINIGLMPLDNTAIELGKCAFKAIQYMSLGIPPVVSPVGANVKVITDGVNGYWAENEEAWYRHLSFLLSNPETRCKMGDYARNHIVTNYSVTATEKNFFGLFS
jgi:glycosyltransferase involved in cell wall biosynthesis